MKKFILSSIAALTLLLTGCTHYYYLPNSHNVPLLTQKNDARFVASKYTGSDGATSVPGFEIQGSYAVTDKIGVMASILHVSRYENGAYGSGNYADLGAGYYKASKSKHWVFEAYGATGFGSADNGFKNNGTSHANFTKLFVQPAIGYKSKYFDMIFSWRIGFLSYSNIRTFGQLSDWDMEGVKDLVAHPTSTVSEPALSMRFGAERIKLQLQYGVSKFNHDSNYRASLSIGAFININGADGKKPSKR